MVNASDIRASIGDFLAGVRSFDDFEDWLVSHTWSIHKWGDIESQVLTYEIELRIAEYDMDGLSPKDLRSELQNIANTFLLNPNDSARVLTASSTSFNLEPWPIRPAGMPPVTAF